MGKIVRAPSRVPYDATALGLGGHAVAIRLTNPGTEPVRVDRLRVAFTATREGVAFRCKEHVGGSMQTREPASLRGGETFTFERDLDCTMPLPGHYDVSAAWQLSDRDRTGSLGTFSIDLVAGKGNLPVPYPARAGLHALMIGNRETRPLTDDAWARGDYRVVLALINGGRQPVEVGPGRLAFLVYKEGSPLPCSGQAEDVALPAALAPGAVHVVRAPVACAPSEEGRYRIIGRFSLVAVGDEIDIGRIPLRVTRDPRLFTPEI
jgi:hypothetical protein